MSTENLTYNESINLADKALGWYASLGQTADMSGLGERLASDASLMVEHGNRKHTIYAGDMLSEAARLAGNETDADELRQKARNAYEGILSDNSRRFEDLPEAIMGLENLETQRIYDAFHKYGSIEITDLVYGLLKIQHESATKFLEVQKEHENRHDFSIGKMLEWSAVIEHRQRVIEAKDATTLVRSSFLREDRAMNASHIPEERDIREFNFDIAHEQFVDGEWQLLSNGGKYAISDHEKDHPYDKSIIVTNFLIPHRKLEVGMNSLMRYVLGEVRYMANPTQTRRANPIDKANAREFMAISRS